MSATLDLISINLSPDLLLEISYPADILLKLESINKKERAKINCSLLKRRLSDA
jgi:hypothetical protein